MYNQQPIQRTLDEFILAMCNYMLMMTLMLSYPQYLQTLFQPVVEKPSALQKLIDKRRKPELSEGAKLALDPDPMALVWKARADMAKYLHISLP